VAAVSWFSFIYSRCGLVSLLESPNLPRLVEPGRLVFYFLIGGGIAAVSPPSRDRFIQRSPETHTRLFLHALAFC